MSKVKKLNKPFFDKNEKLVPLSINFPAFDDSCDPWGIMFNYYPSEKSSLSMVTRVLMNLNLFPKFGYSAHSTLSVERYNVFKFDTLDQASDKFEEIRETLKDERYCIYYYDRLPVSMGTGH